MTTLAVDKQRNFELGDINELPVIATDIIYEGAAVGDNASGYMRPLVAGDPFRGFAEAKVDNSSGLAGAKNVRLRRSGSVQLTITGIAITDVGKAVYASDDDTFTLTSTSNSLIGYVERYVTSNTCVVKFGERAGIATGVINAGGAVVIPASTILSGQLKTASKTVTVASGATSGTGTADSTLTSGTILGVYPTNNACTGGTRLVKTVSINTASTARAKVLLQAAANHAATFAVVVAKAA